MLDPDGLNVWSDRQLVGFLWRDSQGRIGFCYDGEWLISSHRFAISVSLPLKHGDFSPELGIAHRFFANLLPEADARDQVIRDLKIANTDFDLLRAVGGECAGTLSILEAEYCPPVECDYHALTQIELAQLISCQGQLYSLNAHERPRYSLAGAQAKCTVLIRGDRYWLPKKESLSSHILKFELPDYRHLPAYETFTSLLASAVGLPVVDICLKLIADTRFALIKRYDRQLNNKEQITRLHQEDFCQALSFGHEHKYQQDGGPSFVDCYRLLQVVPIDPANDLQHLLHWQIFNVLAGNSDGHAKNLSLLYLPNSEIRLAPFYDLICTRAIERIDYHLAFAVGNERNPGVITQKHWSDMAESCGLHPQFLLDRVYILANSLLKQLQPVREVFETTYGPYPALQRVEQVIVKQCRRALISSPPNT